MFLKGLLLGFSLIVAIGPQNAFVIRQGLKKQRVFLTALLVSFCDFVLITLGIFGVGHFLTQNDWLKSILMAGGILFLFVFGIRSILRAFKNESLLPKENGDKAPLKKFLIEAFSFSWLNPHAILDTVVIIGSVAAHYAFKDSAIFGSGAICASAIWFFVLAYGAKALSVYLEKPVTWKVLDVGIGLICLWIAQDLLIEI